MSFLEVQYFAIRDEIRSGSRHDPFSMPPLYDFNKHLQDKVINRLMLTHGLEAYKDSTYEISDLVYHGRLQNVREVEVMLRGCVEPRDFFSPVSQNYLATVARLLSNSSRQIGSDWVNREYSSFVPQMQAILQEHENNERTTALIRSLMSDIAHNKTITSPPVEEIPVQSVYDHHATLEYPETLPTTAPTSLLLPAPDHEVSDVALSSGAHSPFALPISAAKLYCPHLNCPMNTRGFSGILKHQQSNLTRHLKIHQTQRIKPSCPGCGESFSRPDNLAKHRRISCKA